MSNRPKVRYETAPTLARMDPVCDSCSVNVRSDSDCYECPQCGTQWDYEAAEDEPGDLYADWSGESVDDLPLLDHATGWQWRDPERV